MTCEHNTYDSDVRFVRSGVRTLMDGASEVCSYRIECAISVYSNVAPLAPPAPVTCRRRANDGEINCEGMILMHTVT